VTLLTFSSLASQVFMSSWLSSPAWAESDRGGVIENRHLIHASVVDASGRLLFSLGDPSRPTLLRSAAKPAQALAILESGCFDLYPFDDADLALMCASHSSEDFHVSRARDMLRKIGNGMTEDYLQCGGHPPLSDRVHREWIKNEYEPTGLCNNCSGKHVGMIAATIALGADVGTYHTPNGLTHAHVKKVVQEVTGLAENGNENQVQWGVDGCNLPAPAMPLRHLAGMYASFAASVDVVESNLTLDQANRVGQSGSNSTGRSFGIGATPATYHVIATLPTPIPTPSPSPSPAPTPTPTSAPSRAPNPSSSATPRDHHMSRIFLAMNTHPELVGGTSRFCTALMRSFPGLLIGKLGADGCYGIGIRSCPQTRAMGANGAVGMGVKIEDGNIEVLYAVVVEVLVQLGLLNEAGMSGELKAFWKLERRNTMGVITGRVAMPFKLRVGEDS
jgi:L-asparaginase II